MNGVASGGTGITSMAPRRRDPKAVADSIWEPESDFGMGLDSIAEVQIVKGCCPRSTAASPADNQHDQPSGRTSSTLAFFSAQNEQWNARNFSPRPRSRSASSIVRRPPRWSVLRNRCSSSAL